MSDEKESSRGRLFKIATVAGILGMFLSGFCFGSCLVLVARIRIPEFFDTPLGFKRTPLVGISAVADSALYPPLAALALFWLFFWALLHFFEGHPDQRQFTANAPK